MMVPGAGLEPARGYPREILSLLRLPISPSGQYTKKHHIAVLFQDCFKTGKHKTLVETSLLHK